MKNTEKAGGSRYSEGKPVRAWMPQAALPEVVRKYSAYLTGIGDYAIEALEGLSQWWLSVTVRPGEDNVPSPQWVLELAAAHLVATLGGPHQAMDALARVSNMGAEKYAPFDYLEGQSFTTLFSSAHRHMTQHMSSEYVDQESGEPHLAHALWNVMCMLEFYERGRQRDMDDVTEWVGVTAGEAKKNGWSVGGRSPNDGPENQTTMVDDLAGEEDARARSIGTLDKLREQVEVDVHRNLYGGKL